MSSTDDSGCGKIALVLGVISSLIAIFVFLTGKENIHQIISDLPEGIQSTASPVNIGISIDSAGQVSVTGGFTPPIDVNLGPIGLYAGIQSTVELTKSKPYYLFIIWEDASGEIHREEYEIGKKFKVVFEQKEYIYEILGHRDSIVLAIYPE